MAFSEPNLRGKEGKIPNCTCSSYPVPPKVVVVRNREAPAGFLVQTHRQTKILRPEHRLRNTPFLLKLFHPIKGLLGRFLLPSAYLAIKKKLTRYTKWPKPEFEKTEQTSKPGLDMTGMSELSESEAYHALQVIPMHT